MEAIRPQESEPQKEAELEVEVELEVELEPDDSRETASAAEGGFGSCSTAVAKLTELWARAVDCCYRRELKDRQQERAEGPPSRYHSAAPSSC